MSATKIPAPIATPLDVGNLLAHLCDQALPHVTEAHAQWFAQAPALADGIGSQAAHLCSVLAEHDPLHPDDHAPTFYLLGNLFDLLAGLSNVGAEMTRAHQRLKTQREERTP